MRWLAVHLPLLPLEVFASGAFTRPLAVADGRRLLCCNPQALALGVSPGLSPVAARALTADLQILQRDPRAEAEALERLAAWGLQFTSQVSLQPPRGLLLELAGSRRLFGATGVLARRIAEGMRALGYRPCLALAPTPEGAWLLSTAGRQTAVADLQALRPALAALALEALVEEPRSRAALRGSGLGRIGDLLRLPRAGLAQRLGPEPLARLDRALGQAPDPRPSYRPPSRFQGRLALPGEVQESQGLVFPARRLLLELSGFLTARGQGIRELGWLLLHHALDPTGFRLELQQPERDAERLLELLRQRLERLELSAPVIGLELRADHPEPFLPAAPDLFDTGETVDQAGRHWLDSLRARLGRDRVRGLCLVADYRPERAWSYCPPGDRGSLAYRPGRPLWLLARPYPLELRDGRPWYRGSLRLEAERERIESGWWDAQEIRRDYFIAHTRQGARLWVYRDLEDEGGWFLHGIFGVPG